MIGKYLKLQKTEKIEGNFQIKSMQILCCF